MNVLLLAACTGTGTVASRPEETSEPTVDTGLPEPSGCPPVTVTSPILVTDIDETLTTLDAEWLTQLANPDHVPEMRPAASAVMNQWYDLGFRIVYVTARGEDLPLLDGTPARQATEDWLALKGFPFTSREVFLAPGVGAITNAAEYKTGVLEDLLAAGLTIEWAYGNADSDVEAYLTVGIPHERVWLAGKLAGEFGVRGIPTDQAYDVHLQEFMPGAPCAPSP